MKQLIRKTSSLSYRACLGIWGLLQATTAFANLPQSADDIMPDNVTANTSEPIDTAEQLVRYGLQVLAVLAAVGIVLGVMWKIYGAFSKAQDDKNGWGAFAITTIAGVFVATICVVLAILAVSYL